MEPSLRRLRLAFAVLKNAVDAVERELILIEREGAPLGEVLPRFTNQRVRALIQRTAEELGCPKSEAEAKQWKIGPLLGLKDYEWKLVRNCGPDTLKEILRVLDEYRS